MPHVPRAMARFESSTAPDGEIAFLVLAWWILTSSGPVRAGYATRGHTSPPLTALFSYAPHGTLGAPQVPSRGGWAQLAEYFTTLSWPFLVEPMNSRLSGPAAQANIWPLLLGGR